MSYVAIWLQACLHWRCAYFQTLSWNDTIFLLWIGTYCISCVVQQSSGVKDLSSLVRYDDSSLAAIRHVQSIVPVVRPRPNIRSHSVLSSISPKLSKHWRFLAFWMSLCFGSCLLFLVCHYTAFLFSTRAMTALGWLPNAHRDIIILVQWDRPSRDT